MRRSSWSQFFTELIIDDVKSYLADIFTNVLVLSRFLSLAYSICAKIWDNIIEQVSNINKCVCVGYITFKCSRFIIRQHCTCDFVATTISTIDSKISIPTSTMYYTNNILMYLIDILTELSDFNILPIFNEFFQDLKTCKLVSIEQKIRKEVVENVEQLLKLFGNIYSSIDDSIVNEDIRNELHYITNYLKNVRYFVSGYVDDNGKLVEKHDIDFEFEKEFPVKTQYPYNVVVLPKVILSQIVKPSDYSIGSFIHSNRITISIKYFGSIRIKLNRRFILEKIEKVVKSEEFEKLLKIVDKVLKTFQLLLTF